MKRRDGGATAATRAVTPAISAIDLFCGVGGLSYGLRQAGVAIAAGIDIDPSCRYPFESNIKAEFVERDVRSVTAAHLLELWDADSVRLLAGCAPCQPFSPYRRGIDTSTEEQWPLLAEFGRLASETLPELVTMENVPRIGSAAVFTEFVATLRDAGYQVSWRSCYGPDFSLPQMRRRLVLVGSRMGNLDLPTKTSRRGGHRTVRQAIGRLRPLESGGSDPKDPLHRCRELSALNLKRIRASKPGGTWEDWPEDLRAPCHQKASGASFRNVYARMEWEAPAPTITTMAHNFGTGRFGHPEQDRPISLREAAILQGFPKAYRFVAPQDSVHFQHLGRLIGNAVPPPIARVVGDALVEHARTHKPPRRT